ncbi:hypothetical protein [Polymorphobacter multimanifer]|uniref:Uncharacterized protein n=1 Tax=Polymorphobacter multimanifer TaxID=1070431 RepID=A0A841KZZ3_9SPHN|nr:hypothetical protein [Polymorphobacter multimanifer]MBB6226139.1 hypothetical protein [Polymorphobacter multimanifer]
MAMTIHVHRLPRFRPANKRDGDCRQVSSGGRKIEPTSGRLDDVRSSCAPAMTQAQAGRCHACVISEERKAHQIRVRANTPRQFKFIRVRPEDTSSALAHTMKLCCVIKMMHIVHSCPTRAEQPPIFYWSFRDQMPAFRSAWQRRM